MDKVSSCASRSGPAGQVTRHLRQSSLLLVPFWLGQQPPRIGRVCKTEPKNLISIQTLLFSAISTPKLAFLFFSDLVEIMAKAGVQHDTHFH